MDEHSSALLYRLLYVPIRHAKELLYVLFRVVANINGAVFEEFCTFGVFLAGDVKDMGYATLDKAARLESRNEVAHKQSFADWVHIVGFEQTVALATTEFHVWESAAEDVVFTAVVGGSL